MRRGIGRRWVRPCQMPCGTSSSMTTARHLMRGRLPCCERRSASRLCKSLGDPIRPVKAEPTLSRIALVLDILGNFKQLVPADGAEFLDRVNVDPVSLDRGADLFY